MSASNGTPAVIRGHFLAWTVASWDVLPFVKLVSEKRERDRKRKCERKRDGLYVNWVRKYVRWDYFIDECNHIEFIIHLHYQRVISLSFSLSRSTLLSFFSLNPDRDPATCNACPDPDLSDCFYKPPGCHIMDHYYVDVNYTHVCFQKCSLRCWSKWRKTLIASLLNFFDD